MLFSLNLATVSGQLAGPTVLHLLLVALVILSATFWVGARIWLVSLLQQTARSHEEQLAIFEQVQQNFERRFSPSLLIILFLANLSILAEQSFSLSAFWLMSEVVTAVALLFGVYLRLAEHYSSTENTAFSYVYLALGLVLLAAISGYFSMGSGNVIASMLPVEWLLLLAAALCVGGLMFLVAVYLPTLRQAPAVIRAHSLLSVLTCCSLLAMVGLIIMTTSIFIDAEFQNSIWTQLLAIAYGQSLVLLVLLIGWLLLVSVILLGILRPRLGKEYVKYVYASQRLQKAQTLGGSNLAIMALIQQVKQREGRLASRVHQVADAARWTAAAGVGVLICVSLMNVFASTPTLPGTALRQPTTVAAITPFTATAVTTDNEFKVTLTVNPNHFGPNLFTVRVVDNNTGVLSTNVHVSLSLVMLDMDMETDKLDLQADGKGHFSGTGELSMTGNWEIFILIRTSDIAQHEAQVRLLTPF